MKIIEGFRLRKIMGRYVIVGEGISQIDFNKLIILNPSAAFLWQSIEGKDFTTEDLSALLVEKYGVSMERAIKDTIAIVVEWLKNGLICI